MTNRGFVGTVWIVAALLCVLVVAVDPMGLSTSRDWTKTYSNPDMAQGVAIAMILGLVGLVGLFWRRLRGEDSPDRELKGPLDANPWQIWPARIGVVIVTLGAVIVAGNWLYSHHHPPAGELLMSANDTQETVAVTQGDRTISVHLPMRATLHDIEVGEEPRIWLQFARPDTEIAFPTREQLREFVPGQSLDVEGMRFVFSGLAQAKTTKTVTLSTTGEDPVEVSGAIGDRVQIGDGGRNFQIIDAVDNYLDVFLPAPGMDTGHAQLMSLARGYSLSAVGPAVQLEDDRGQRFWVFQRDGDLVDESDYVGVSLTLDEVRELPAAVMTITPVRPFWPFALGIALFVLGWTLLLVFPERVIRRRDDKTLEFWSINGIEDLGADKPTDGGGWTLFSNIAVPLVAAVALGLALFVGATAAGVLIMAALVAAVGLPQGLDDRERRRAALVAGALPLAAIVGAGLALGQPGWSANINVESLLWTAQIGGWMAMATALIGAGVLAERSLGRRSTKGAVTAAVSMWSAMAAVVAIGMQRGRATGEGMSLWLTSEAGEAFWSVPNLEAAADLKIGVVAASGQLTIVAGVVALFGALGIAGAVMKRKKVALAGWAGTMLGSLAGVFTLLGVGQAAGQPDAAIYERIGERWLQARELPGWIAEMGEFHMAGELVIDSVAHAPEIVAFLLVSLLSATMLVVTMTKSAGQPASAKEEDRPEDDGLAGRDLFVRALLFGLMGWVLGLVLAWERLGAAGVLGPMEWLGLSIPLFALGVLLLGWRQGTSAPARLLRAYGPALVLGYLILVVAIGAAGGVAPGASIPLIQ